MPAAAAQDPAAVRPRHPDGAEHRLHQLGAALGREALRRDPRDDFYCSNPDGSLVDRAAFLQQTAKPVPITNLRAEDVLIRIIGDFAVIHARTAYTKPDGSAGGGRYTDGYAKIGGQWLAVFAHVTRL